jgi:hypothetical protein
LIFSSIALISALRSASIFCSAGFGAGSGCSLVSLPILCGAAPGAGDCARDRAAITTSAAATPRAVRNDLVRVRVSMDPPVAAWSKTCDLAHSRGRRGAGGMRRE